MALDHAKITQYIRDTNEMVVQLGDYIAQPEYERDEADSGDVRRLRIAVAALNAACEEISHMPGPIPVVMPSFPPASEPPPPPGIPPEAMPPQQTPDRLPGGGPPAQGGATPRARRGAPVNPGAPSNIARL